jgi:hypothetical protein
VVAIDDSLNFGANVRRKVAELVGEIVLGNRERFLGEAADDPLGGLDGVRGAEHGQDLVDAGFVVEVSRGGRDVIGEAWGEIEKQGREHGQANIEQRSGAMWRWWIHADSCSLVAWNSKKPAGNGNWIYSKDQKYTGKYGCCVKFMIY